MSKIRVSAFAVSMDGYAAGPHQSLENPLGVRGPELFEWFFSTRTWKQMHGQEGGTTGVDNEWAQRGMENVGAWILGRNMFGPVRGPWPDNSWKGWWGEEPPYHVPTFVLTHHARPPVEMKGGTTFHFVTEGIHSALQRAGMYESVGELRRFKSISAQGLSTNFTSHFVRFLWARERVCSRALIWQRSAIAALKMCRANTPCTWS
jgi:dihydrofolate reductase